MLRTKLPPRPRREREPGEFASFTPKPRAAAMAAALHQAAPSPAPKPQTFRSVAWLRAVASLRCVLCPQEGQSQASHVNMGKGMGIKTHDCWTAALCMACHARIDQGKDMTRAERRATLDTAVLLTLAELAKKGLVKPA